MRSRTSLAACAALGSVAVLLTGCLPEVGNAEDRNSIEVMYDLTGEAEDAFRDEVQVWAQEHDVEVMFSPTDSIEQLIATRVQGNAPPDVALFPQPEIMRQLADRGQLRDLSDVVDRADQEAMIPDVLDAGQVNDGLFAVPVGVDVTSLVFFLTTSAGQAGLTQAPATLEDLQALTEEMVLAGTTPWCLGVASDEAPGWPATDWVENLVLITHGSETYEQWVNHDIPFNDPRIADVLRQMESLLLEEGKTYGGRLSSAETDSDTAADPMLDDPPGCQMYRQSSSAARESGLLQDISDEVEGGVGVFRMPGRTPEDRPVLGSGQFAGVFSQADDAAVGLVEFLASSSFGTHGLGASGHWISPRTDFDLQAYPDDTWREIADIAYSSTEFALDGSDRMPDEASRSFGLEMTAWISGEEDSRTALDNVEESWPT